jgi:diaminopimelate decarboxylase
MIPSGSPHLAWRNGQLFIEGCALGDLARRFGTPLYVYSRSAMLDAVHAYQSSLLGRDYMLAYAVKANSNLAVLGTLAQAGCGFDIVSGGELERVLAAGGNPQKIVFSGVGKTRNEMQAALRAGVACFNVESEAELELLSQTAQAANTRARISLRVNPDVDAKTHPYISTGLKSNKFGIAHEQALATYVRAAKLPGIEVVGIDCHIGSQITEMAPYLDALDRVLDLVQAVEAQGIAIDHIDMGGGLGISYADETPPDIGDLLKALLARIDERSSGKKRRLILEPGRSIVGSAGVLLTTALYLKESLSKNFCVVDAGMNDLLRPTLYQAWMPIVNCLERSSAPVLMDVVGPVCESSDWMGRDRHLAVTAGDTLAVLCAGAYGMSMASHYNSRALPAEVMVQGEQAQLVRERESLAALFERESTWEAPVK